MSYVVATAGHVDHGKSTLVKRVTGREPDRWEEERRRGLTIDLGFVWTRLSADGASADGAADVAFVDVPGHERFIANMLAGVGPAPAVMLVVAADEGVRQQTTDHLEAIDAFGIRIGVIAISRADRADDARRARTRAEVARLACGTTAADWPVVEVSAVTGEGIDRLAASLVSALQKPPAGAPGADPGARVRVWVDRSFTVAGAGTVVTGTLGAGTIRPGDTLELGGRTVSVRNIQSEDAPIDEALPVSRVALNLRGVGADEVARGDALTTPGAWHFSSVLDVALRTGGNLDELPREVVAHIGTAAVPCRVRALGPRFARLSLASALPLTIGDRVVLRGSGEQRIAAGVEAVDVDPPAFTRRGDAARRAAELDRAPDIMAEIGRRAAVTPQVLARLGYDVPAAPPQGAVAYAGYWILAAQVMAWKQQLVRAVAEHEARDPLSAGMSVGEAVDKLALPDAKLVALAAAAAKLRVRDGVIGSGRPADLGDGVAKLEAHLRNDPFAAPEARDLEVWGVGTRELAAAERAGRVVRLADGVVLLADAPERAAAILRELDQPFTASQARKAWGTTRRVAIPLLELLDARGVTRRVDGTARVLR